MKRIILALLSLIFIVACSSSDEPKLPQDNFDREAMLLNWADNIIMPGYKAYLDDLSVLVISKDAFIGNITKENLSNLKTAWLTAYISWQKVSMFEIGKAETLTLRDFSNIFPTSVDKIETSIASGSYDLALPSTRDQQGFPAIDYLLNGIADNDIDIVAKFNQDKAFTEYLSLIVDRLYELASQVKYDWDNGYRETFISNSGSSASSSVNKLVNDYMQYYEKTIRAGKIGIPAGVFSNTPLKDKVEARYAITDSRLLYETALKAAINFFNGVHFDNNGSGKSLKSYLNFVHSLGSTDDLATMINEQFELSLDKSSLLDDNFMYQIETNNQAMLETYDALQANVILLKVDMFQALNIKVDFVDADGD